MKIGIAASALIAITALIGSSVPIMEVPYTEIVQYQDTEIYYEDEPYEVTETYYETEPYEEIETYYEDEPYEDTETQAGTRELAYKVTEVSTEIVFSRKQTKQVPFGVDETIELFNPKAVITLENTDKERGTFIVQFTWYYMFRFRFEDAVKVYPERTRGEIIRELGSMGVVKVEGDKRIYSEESVVLGPNMTHTFESRLIDIEVESEDDLRYVWDWDYIIAAREMIERTVTKYRQVQKENTTTKYRQVQKQRIMIKQRPETRYKKVTLLDYLIHY